MSPVSSFQYFEEVLRSSLPSSKCIFRLHTSRDSCDHGAFAIHEDSRIDLRSSAADQLGTQTPLLGEKKTNYVSVWTLTLSDRFSSRRILIQVTSYRPLCHRISVYTSVTSLCLSSLVYVVQPPSQPMPSGRTKSSFSRRRLLEVEGSVVWRRTVQLLVNENDRLSATALTLE